jgi:hypothetical protein
MNQLTTEPTRAERLAAELRRLDDELKRGVWGKPNDRDSLAFLSTAHGIEVQK